MFTNHKVNYLENRSTLSHLLSISINLHILYSLFFNRGRRMEIRYGLISIWSKKEAAH